MRADEPGLDEVASEPERYRFEGDGRFPNSRLPVLVHRRALPADPRAMIMAFAAHGWSNAWRDRIFTTHHFHSVAHEVLGIAAGSVRVALGGPGGRTVALEAGDVVVIPAGVAHRNVGQSGDLRVVGAYPGGADYDTRRGNPSESEAVRAVAAAVSPEVNDPVTGAALGAVWAIASA